MRIVVEQKLEVFLSVNIKLNVIINRFTVRKNCIINF